MNFQSIYVILKERKKNKKPGAEDYTEELAIVHVRRLLDIVACTTCFGSAKPAADRTVPKEPASKEPAGVDNGPSHGSESSDNSKAKDNTDPSAAAAAVSMCPPPRLGQFYDFFSFSHLTPPIQCKIFLCVRELFLFFFFSTINVEVLLIFIIDIRRSSRPFLEDKTEDDFFQIDVSGIL